MLRASFGGCPSCCLRVILLGIDSSFFGVDTVEECVELPGFFGDCSECVRLIVEDGVSLPMVLSRLIFLESILLFKPGLSSFCRCRSLSPSSTIFGVDDVETGFPSSAIMVEERVV